MQSNFLLLLTFSALAVASPAAVVKKDSRHVYITTGTNWGGAKQNVEVENNQMYKWNDKVIWQGHHWFGSQSVGPDEGVCCVLYDQNWTPSGTICHPGLADVGAYWLSHTQHFKCWW